MEKQIKPKLTKCYIDSKGVKRIFFDHKGTKSEGHCKLTMGYTERVYNDNDELVRETKVVEVSVNIDADWYGLYRMVEKCEIESLKVEVTTDDIFRN